MLRCLLKSSREKMKKFFLCVFVFLILAEARADNRVSANQNESDVDELVRSHSGKIEELEHRIKIIEQNLGISHSRYTTPKSLEEVKKEIKGKSPEEVIEMANDLIKLDRCNEARDILNTFVKENPKSLYIGRMYFYLGKSYFEEKDYQNAAKAYMESFEINPNGAKTPKALFRLSSCFFKLGKQDQRKMTLEKLATTFPQFKYGKKAIAKLEELKKS